MLKSLTQLFARAEDDAAHSQAQSQAQSHADELHLAAAVLMVEAINMDGEVVEEETQAVERLLAGHFSLDETETRDLMDMAQDRHSASVSLHRYTKTIKDRFSEEERVELIELLWEVVYSDGSLHAHESNLLRRIGGLIYVSDRDRGDARKRVLQRLSAEQ
jgi:uncharacterized tellurite resistance protein B-like protein